MSLIEPPGAYWRLWCVPTVVESGHWRLCHGDCCCVLELNGHQPADGGVPLLTVVKVARFSKIAFVSSRRVHQRPRFESSVGQPTWYPLCIWLAVSRAAPAPAGAGSARREEVVRERLEVVFVRGPVEDLQLPAGRVDVPVGPDLDPRDDPYGAVPRVLAREV